MNPRLTTHIGSTLAQGAVLRYRMQQRELEAERARFDRTTAALQVDALLDRARQPEPCCFCAEPQDVSPPLSPWVFWPIVVTCSGALTFAAYELARLAVAIGSMP